MQKLGNEGQIRPAGEAVGRLKYQWDLKRDPWSWVTDISQSYYRENDHRNQPALGLGHNVYPDRHWIRLSCGHS